MADTALFVLVLTVLATTVMAITGVVQAARYQFDPFGAAVLGLITAVGGGTLRDLLIGATPVFWLTDLIYIGTIVPVTVISVLFVGRMRAGGGRRLRFLSVIDAFGLGLFTVTGTAKALGFGLHPVIAVLMGCITGIAGGMLRDLLCGEPPVVLKQDFYAIIALAGGALYCLLYRYIGIEWAMLATIGFVAVVRITAIYRHWSMPPLSRTNS
ncbi:trimeric intracellular cation channel family protein [Gammaproteobacteria bacterium]|nr:trimeric intracellular cation channel family protein [Gammaproteobacteria bacterium]